MTNVGPSICLEAIIPCLCGHAVPSPCLCWCSFSPWQWLACALMKTFIESIFLIPGEIPTCVTLWLLKSCLLFLFAFILLYLPVAPYTAHDLRTWHGLRTAQERRRRRSASWRIFSNNNVLVVDWFLYFVSFQTFWRLDWFLSVHTSDKGT